MPIFFGEKISV